jgi:hypothetical protein
MPALVLVVHATAGRTAAVAHGSWRVVAHAFAAELRVHAPASVLHLLELERIARKTLDVGKRDVTPWKLEVLRMRSHHWIADLAQLADGDSPAKAAWLASLCAWASRREAAIEPEARTSSYQPLRRHVGQRAGSDLTRAVPVLGRSR